MILIVDIVLVKNKYKPISYEIDSDSTFESVEDKSDNICESESVEDEHDNDCESESLEDESDNNWEQDEGKMLIVNQKLILEITKIPEFL